MKCLEHDWIGAIQMLISLFLLLLTRHSEETRATPQPGIKYTVLGKLYYKYELHQYEMFALE